MHIRNVTEEFDSLDARYECHARKVDGINRIRHGFSVNVIRCKYTHAVFIRTFHQTRKRIIKKYISRFDFGAERNSCASESVEGESQNDGYFLNGHS